MRYLNNRNRITRSGSANATAQGLFLRPFIEDVVEGSILPNQTTTITLTGHHFEQESTVTIEENSITVDSVEYISPNELQVELTTGSVTGNFTIVVWNNQLNSDETGKNKIRVKENEWVDLRTIAMSELGLEATNGVIVNQDVNRGLWASGTGNTWNRGVKFTAYSWNRSDELEFSFVFTRSGNGMFMFGIGGDQIDVNNLGDQSYYRGEALMYHPLDYTNYFYGGGLQSDWDQNIGQTVNFLSGGSYKVKFHQSAKAGTLISIHLVNPNNWDEEINTLHEWTSTCPAANPILMPFWSAVNSPNTFITGFKIF